MKLERFTAQVSHKMLWFSTIALSGAAEIYFCSADPAVVRGVTSLIPESNAVVPLASLTFEHIDSAIQLLERIFMLAS